jgi:hypothetical protein
LLGKYVATMPRADDGLLTSYRLTPGRLDDTLARVHPFVAPFRARAASHANRPTPHRLVRLVEATDSDLFAIRRGGAGRNLLDVIELEHVVSLLEEAQQNPAGRSIFRSIADPRSYAHDVLVLAVARLLQGWGNSVRLIESGGPTRSADLQITSPAVAVELKAPRELADDETIVSRSPADVAAAALEGSSAQRRTTRDSILVVAGYRLPEFVRQALTDRLAAATVRRTSLVASVVISLGSHPVDWPPAREFRDQVALEVAATVLRNDAYRGAVKIVPRAAKADGVRLPNKGATTRRTIP